MLLEMLSAYADQLDLPPTMYAKTAVRWFIDLDEKGNLLGFVPLEGSGKKNDRGKEMLVPTVGRSSGARPKLLADNGEYVLGRARESSKQKRVDECHRMFKRIISQCAEATDEPSIRSVEAFLSRWDPSLAALPDNFDPSMNLTFRVGSVIPVDLPKVQEFWANRTQPSSEARMQCLTCGKMEHVVERHQRKIKKIPGGQAAGMALISANATAFLSHGLKASYVAPTCRKCAERFANAANELLRNDETHLTVGPLAYVLWTRGEPKFSIATLLSRPDPEAIQQLITFGCLGRFRESADESVFYAAAFSASGGRVVVRDWIRTTVGEVKWNLARWFTLQLLVGPDGSKGSPLGLYALAASLYRDAGREMSPNLPQRLLRVALQGGVLPSKLLFQAVTRNRAEQNVTRSRVALMKMVLMSQRTSNATKEDMMEQLDISNRSPAYLCGRLMAEIEAVQRAAIPGARTTVISGYFGAASSAPASVFGTLLRNAQAHLCKLTGVKKGACYVLQSRLEEIMNGLTEFPQTLTLKDQAIFSLGYYHQRAANRAAAIAHKKNKRAKAEA